MTGMGRVAALAILVGFAAGSAFAGTVYSVDDGVAEGNIGFDLPGDFWWANGFTSSAQREVISISYMFITQDRNARASNVSQGDSLLLLIYNDPDDDGNPLNAILARQVSTTIGTLDTFHTVTVPKTVVGDTFFIGALYTQTYGASGSPPNQFPAARDMFKNPGVSWIAASTGTLNPANLGTAQTGVLRMNDYGLSGVFMLRAEAVPEPGTIALLGFGGLLMVAAARRKRRRRA